MTHAAVWPPETGVSDARLAYCAARPYLRRHAKPWWLSLFRLAEVYGGPYTGRSAMARGANRQPMQPPLTVDEICSDRLRPYAFACDRVAERLDEAERERLRRTGELPAWFLPAVKREAKQIKRELCDARD